jgi:ABC-2 type transport system ATP-binding protein/sodium transport system ATP-binding protein
MIILRGLSRRFEANGRIVLAVDELSLAVAAGEVYGLLGPNGAGKTTTLRMILGLLSPSAGDVEIQGARVTEHPEQVKRRIGLVSASAGLYQWLTPREILEYFAAGYGLDDDTTRSRIAMLAARMELESFLDRRSATLSTGQKQRVTLARSLIHDPPVVLLDEPTRGLDVVGSQVVFDFVRDLRAEGKAIIVSTHQLDEAERLCDRFGLLHRGRLRYEGTLDELRTATGHATLVDMFLALLRETVASSADAPAATVPAATVPAATVPAATFPAAEVPVASAPAVVDSMAANSMAAGSMAAGSMVARHGEDLD